MLRCCVLTEVLLLIPEFWALILCHLASSFGCLEGSYCFVHRGGFTTLWLVKIWIINYMKNISQEDFCV